MMSTAAGKKLLIVDDEPEIREILKILLHDYAETIYEAGNGREALEIARAHEIHTILSDIQMPVMTGLELLRELRKGGNDVPLIFLTAYGEKSNLLEALRLGALDFIEKPFEEKSVSGAVQQALNLGVAMREIDHEIEKLETGQGMSPEEVTRLKNMRKAVLIMTAECEVYAYPPAGVGEDPHDR